MFADLRYMLLCLLSIALFSGCGDAERVSEKPDQGAQAEARGSSHGLQPTMQSGEGLAVIILPENPTVTDDLYAKVAGTRDPVSYVWRKNGEEIAGETDQALAKEHLVKGALIEVTASSGTSEVVAEITIGNSLPVLKSVDLIFSKDITARPKAEDADGDEIGFRYLWVVNGEELPWEDQAVLPTDRVVRGDRVAIQITPFDVEGEGKSVLGKELTVENKPPRIVSTPSASFNGPVFTYEVKAEDPDGDVLTFSLESAPEGMAMDSSTGVIVWNLTEKNLGEYQVKIKVTDPLGMWTTQEFPLIIKAMEGK